MERRSFSGVACALVGCFLADRLDTVANVTCKYYAGVNNIKLKNKNKAISTRILSLPK